MGLGYSLDLRQKLVEAWKKRALTVEELSELFGVGTATVKRWQRRYRETGAVEPRPHGGGRRVALTQEQVAALRGLVMSQPDWTEEEYTENLRTHHGMQASRSAVGRAIRRMGFSVKKRPSQRRREIVQMSDEDASNICETSASSPLRVWFLWTKPARTSR
jgi:transposase